MCLEQLFLVREVRTRRGLSGGLRKGRCITILTRTTFCFYLFVCHIFQTESTFFSERGGLEPEGFFLAAFQTTSKKMRFNCTGAHGLHEIPRRGTPKWRKVTSKTHTHRFQESLFLKKSKIIKRDRKKVSKRVRRFPANVPWAPLGAPSLPHFLFNPKRYPKRLPSATKN